MGENFVEKLEESSKSLKTRAGYTRRFLEKQKISDDDFIKKSGDIGVTVSAEDVKDDKKLVTKIYEIQKAVGLTEADSKEGTDGMFGPYTLGKVEEFIVGRAERKDTSARVADDAKTEGSVAAAAANDDAKEPDSVAQNPSAPIQQEPVEAPPAKLDPNSNKNETPKANLDKILKTFPGKSEVVRLAGNGGRQVVIYIPEGFNASKPVEIDYHFHGTYSNWVDVPIPKLNGTSPYYNTHVGKFGVGSNRINQALAAAQKHKNMIMVYPLSAGRRGRVGSTGYKQGYDNDWMEKGNSTNDDMASLHTETLAQLSTMLGQEVNSPSVTLSGHSAGGVAVRNAIVSGFAPDKAKFLDASYGGWASFAKAKADKKTKFEIYVRAGENNMARNNTDNTQTRSLEGKRMVAYVRTRDIIHDNFIAAYL